MRIILLGNKPLDDGIDQGCVMLGADPTFLYVARRAISA